jgi:energy-coupling factor transporter ATP-binding protein EcfA2
MTAHVGVVFDDPAAQLSGVTTTVFEEVAFGPANLGVPRQELLERTERALESLGIADLGPRDPARLSGGQQQLVAVASILALRPRHIILDEPTAQLDPHGTELVGSAIAGLRREGIAVLVVEHKTDLLVEVADRVLVLDDGEVSLSGSAEEILGHPGLVELGVAPPSLVALRRRLTEAGVDISGLPSVAPR